MIDVLQLIVLAILLIASVVDLKKKEVPSFFLTTGIFIVALVSFSQIGFSAIAYGVFAFILGMLLYDLDFFKGVADIKALVLIGLLISTMKVFFIFVMLLVAFGLVYKLLIKLVLKKPDDYQIPFLLAITLAYLFLIIIVGAI